MHPGAVWFEARKRLKDYRRVRESPRIGEEHAEISIGLGIVGVKLNGMAPRALGLDRSRLARQGDAKIVVMLRSPDSLGFTKLCRVLTQTAAS